MSGRSLSEEEARRLLLSLDPKTLDQIVAAQHLRAGLGSGDQQDGRDSLVSSSVSGHVTLPGSAPAHLGDLSAAAAASPSLKRISVGSMDVKSGVFQKKKSIPSLVMTFNAANKFVDNTQDAVESSKKENEDTLSRGARILPPAQSASQLLSVESVMDKMETASLASFRSGASNTSKSVHSLHSYTDSRDAGAKSDKKQRFFDFLTMVSSIHYGIGIFMGSVVAYASDLIMQNSYRWEITEVWNLVLSSVGIALLLWLIVDIETYIRKINKMSRQRNVGAQFKLVEGPDGEFHIEIPMNNKDKKRIPEYYGFTTGRHAGSFFLPTFSIPTTCGERTIFTFFEEGPSRASL